MAASCRGASSRNKLIISSEQLLIAFDALEQGGPVEPFGLRLRLFIAFLWAISFSGPARHSFDFRE